MADAPEKLDLRSHDVGEERRQELLRLFPEVRTEGGKLDFERLKLALGETVDPGRERYGLTWPGKADCFRTIQAPSLATLRPRPEESIDFDTTQNVIIEGDNLEVLKLLQKGYLGKVKLIYIDPPYNTGKEFIYPDNYSESLQTYLEYTGQVDADGRPFETNTDRDGRFHTKWLNMIYPRLYLARNLLREDGLIFISIDDNELANLTKICDEIFGEENYTGTFVWEKKKKPSFLSAQMGVTTEYVLTYARDRSQAPPLVGGKAEEGKLYPFNNAGNPLATLTFPPGSVEFGLPDVSLDPQDMSEGNIRTELLDRVVIAKGRNLSAFRLRGEWRYSQAKLDEMVAAGERVVIRRLPFRPNYVHSGDKDKKIANLLSVRGTGTPTYEDATAEIRDLFGADVAEYPKPTGLLQTLLLAATTGEDLVLDFFAGSGTTADAVVGLNRRDGGRRRFVVCQLPERCAPDSIPAQNGFATIADVMIERIRRASERARKEILGALPSLEVDLGFRVFRLATSCFRPWDASTAAGPTELADQLSLHIPSVLPGRAEGDVLFEVLLKSGFPLAAHITRIGPSLFSVAAGALIICLDPDLTLDAVRCIASQKPERCVFLESGFSGRDALKANAVQLLRSAGTGSIKTV